MSPLRGFPIRQTDQPETGTVDALNKREQRTPNAWSYTNREAMTARSRGRQPTEMERHET